jgi:type IV secretion system protein VirD4
MNGKTIAIAVAVVAYIVAGFFLAEYIAGVAYFLVNKSSPAEVGLDTWAQYWHWYSTDPVQRKRLQLGAGIAGVVVYLIPLMVISAMNNNGRSLHGDARWATAGEIREAGLL